MRGRVYAVNTMFTGTANQLGDFRAGAAAAYFGTIPAVLIGGFSTLAVVLISTRVFRELYKADTYSTSEAMRLPAGPGTGHHIGGAMARSYRRPRPRGLPCDRFDMRFWRWR